MKNEILTLDEDGLRTSLKIIMGFIPWSLDSKVDRNFKEAYYHILYAAILRVIGFDITAEHQNFKGMMDGKINLKNTKVVLEFKYGKDKSTERMLKEALDQTHDMDYYAPFMDSNVILLQIAFKYKDDVDCRLQQLHL